MQKAETRRVGSHQTPTSDIYLRKQVVFSQYRQNPRDPLLSLYCPTRIMSDQPHYKDSEVQDNSAAETDEEWAQRRRENKTYKRLVVFCKSAERIFRAFIDTHAQVMVPASRPMHRWLIHQSGQTRYLAFHSRRSSPHNTAQYTGKEADPADIDWDDWIPASNVTRLSRNVRDAQRLGGGKEIEQICLYQVRRDLILGPVKLLILGL